MLFFSIARYARYGSSKGRGPLLAKFAPIGFKKGFGAVGLGRHTKKGFFLINKMLVPNLHVPEHMDPELKPYVSPKTIKYLEDNK
ncbi:Mitochondrial ribosomal protein L27 family protein [Babesia bovis T2Bo]|uniref:60S ribosomal protein L27, putative n=1 Tax=Babesia bovis TaxID=5865 RepID=A7AUQ0_BABBO|nr:Mitochondrial ribosomal protein L27 family protein [Babesia bovis T2Bo]EDO06661.1 Mitochondrial ribosomal protein L27 family protein [Babesia bovis T2Bo]|eukprot:XP_001610229.1 60S ribosomal protein L27 [Babesia bovis T2Bo]